MTGDPGPGEVCRLLPWDSDFFGFPIATTSLPRLDGRLAAETDAWCEGHGVACLYLLAESGDPGTAIRAGEHGFRLVDIRVTLDRPLEAVPAPPAPAGFEIDLARGADRDALVPIARASHTDSRFFADPGFPREKCASLYETWITRSIEGWADAVLVARFGGVASGYVTCHVEGDRGRIGLVGVGEGARGRGVAGALVESALTLFASRGASRAEVVTQGRNVGAQRLYQKAGFRTSALQLWFHKWYRAPGAPEGR